jgi:hypothetical protein
VPLLLFRVFLWAAAAKPRAVTIPVINQAFPAFDHNQTGPDFAPACSAAASLHDFKDAAAAGNATEIEVICEG